MGDVLGQGLGDAIPLVTVAMPIYNAGKDLRAAVLSIVSQTFTNWELLIIDDGSTDNALEFISDIQDARIRIIQDGLNKGLAARLNECIQLARGHYLARMDQDDVSYPERFALQVSALNKDPSLDLVAVRAITIDENNEATGLHPYAHPHDKICARPWLGFYLPHPTWMGRIEWFRKHRYAQPGPYFCEDQELLLRSYRMSRFATLEEVLFAYRMRGSTNWRKIIKTRKAVLGVQLRHFVMTGQWFFIVLSISVFVGRITADLFKMIGRSLFQLQSKSPLSDIYYSRWQEVIRIISEKRCFVPSHQEYKVSDDLAAQNSFTEVCIHQDKNKLSEKEKKDVAQRGNGIPGLANSKGLLWFIYFCYAVVAALLFQKLLLPLVPGLHAGSGLLQGDAAYFHDVAVQCFEAIRANGWGALEVLVGKQPLHILALSALYVVFGQDPSLLIPINAGFHALGGVLLYLIGRELWPGKVGTAGGLVAASLFILFPSALNWYGQLHKDGFAIAGIFAILLCWLRLVNSPMTWKNGLQILAGITMGMLLVASVRPYFVTLIFVSGLFLGFLLCGYIFSSRGRDLGWNVLGYWVAALLVLLIGVKLSQNVASGVNYHDGMDFAPRGAVAISETSVMSDWRWQKTSWLPTGIDRYFEAAGHSRVTFIYYNIINKAGSGIDLDVAPDNALSVLLYLPRALQISLFAPFPTTWFAGMSMMRLVSIFEMSIWYLCIPGVLLALFFRRSPALAVAIGFSLFFLGVLGFVSPNVGSLYRIRYPFLFIFLLIGVLGWADFLIGWRENRVRKISLQTPLPDVLVEKGATRDNLESGPLHSRSTVFSAGATVIILTLFCYIGFFLRDVLMARTFGTGDALDSFYIGMMLPMFLVSVFSLPFAGALTPVFQQMHLRQTIGEVRLFVRRASLALTCLLVGLSVVLLVISPHILPLVGWNFSPEKIQNASWILMLFLPVLALSGMVVIGNALLNALGKFFIPGVAQLIVPVTAIATLVVWGEKYGVATVAVGMIGGQFLNLVMVALSLRKEGLSILPAPPKKILLPPSMISQYASLAAAAVFVSALIPIDNSMASSLEAGSVATLGLGMKMVVFITGLIGAVVTSVMIPYFSQFMARRRIFAARRELSFFLIVTTLVTIPVALLLFFFSSQIIGLAFQGGSVGAEDALAIARVMRFGIIQLPFFACGMLVTRYITANQRAGVVMLAAGIGVVLNIVLNYLLMGWLGVAGIALSTTLAMAVSTAILIIMVRHDGHIAWFDVVLLGLSWLLYLTLVVCLHYESYTGIFIVCAALLWLPFEQSRTFARMRRSADGTVNGYVGS